MGADIGIIIKPKGSAWYTLDNGEKINGEVKLRDYIEKNPDYAKYIIEKFNEVMNESDGD